METTHDTNGSLSNLNTNTIVKEKIINLFAIAREIEGNIKASTNKNQSFLGFFRQVEFSKPHIKIREELLEKVNNLLSSLSTYTNEEILKNARDIFFEAMTKSKQLHQQQKSIVLSKLELKKDGKTISFGDVPINEIGVTVATDQHFILAKYYYDLFQSNTEFKFLSYPDVITLKK